MFTMLRVFVNLHANEKFSHSHVVACRYQAAIPSVRRYRPIHNAYATVLHTKEVLINKKLG